MKHGTRPRTYRMAARADAAAQTHRRIVEAAIDQLGQRAYDEVGLADVARAAGVTVQTVLRRFGSKEGLAEAAAAEGEEQVRRARWSAPAGDLDATVRGLVEHYEAWGEQSLRFLAQEARVPPVRRVTEAGRALHHEWVDHAFEPWLTAARGAARSRLRARLIAATDVYTWKIYRQDLGLERRALELTFREALAALVA